MTDVFSAPPSTVVESSSDKEGNAFERLVGDGKKFKDTEALAKGKEEADAHIARLESELAEIRQDFNDRALEDYLRFKADREVAKAVPETPAVSGIDPNAQNNGLDAESIRKLINETLTQEQTKAVRDANVRTVQNELVKVWGPAYVATLRDKATELGLGEDFLNDVAAKSPKAFLSLVGASPKEASRNVVTPPVTSGMQSMGVMHGNAAGVRGKTYYDNLRKQDPAKYHSKEVTIQRHNDALRMGIEAFNNS